MTKTVEYKTLDERFKILDENADLILIEEQNIIEGNFLIFSDSPPTKEVEVVYINLPKQDIDDLREKTDQFENQTAEYFLDIDFRVSTIELGL